MTPHYELSTLPDPSWPTLTAVLPSGERREVSRALWGHDIAQGADYCRAGGYTRRVDLGPGLVGFFMPGGAT